MQIDVVISQIINREICYISIKHEDADKVACTLCMLRIVNEAFIRFQEKSRKAEKKRDASIATFKFAFRLYQQTYSYYSLP